jgi:hypothetical protein
MLGSASQTLQNINAQARVLEARVVQTQMENEAKMARQKSVFEQKLKSQEDRSRTLQATNTQLSGEIEALRTNISALRKEAKDVQGENKLRRREMAEISGRLVRAKAFLLNSLKVTDDEKAPELDVLRGKTSVRKVAGRKAAPALKVAKRLSAPVEPAKKLASEDDSDSKDDEDEDPSFIALSSSRKLSGRQPTAAGSPKDVLNVLGEAVTNLQKEEKASEAQLKGIFLANFKAGVKRYASLAAQQRALLATRKSLITEQGELIKADGHLQGTSLALQKQLRDFGMFAQRLAHLALAPPQEAATLLKSLPSDVMSSHA